MTPPIPRVVFDCVIYAQAIISDRGPAAECLERVRAGELRLIWSDYVLQEIRELPEKLPTHLRVTLERVEIFILAIAPYVEHVLHIPEIYRNPFDPDDSHYVNLAAASNARLITTRDGDLLNLMDESRPEGRDFRRRFPDLQICRQRNSWNCFVRVSQTRFYWCAQSSAFRLH